jgi:hypothetical protein
VFRKVIFSTEAVDKLNEWSSNTFTAAAAGIYHFACFWASTPAGSASVNEQVRVDVYKNGTRILAGQSAQAQSSGVTYNSITSVTGTIDLAASDTLEFYVVNTTSAVSTGGGTATGQWATIARVA